MLTKKELISEIAAGAEIAKADVERVLHHLTETVHSCLAAGEELVLPGLGKLSTKVREARTGRNPATGESVDIPAKTVVKFAAAKPLKDAVAS